MGRSSGSKGRGFGRDRVEDGGDEVTTGGSGPRWDTDWRAGWGAGRGRDRDRDADGDGLCDDRGNGNGKGNAWAWGRDLEDKPGNGWGRDRDADRSCGDDAPPACMADDILFIGTDADETITGDCGNDELYGARGQDTLSGGHGNDYLSGNWDADVLIGGAGRDTFAFDGDFGRDTVQDFAPDEDRLQFVFYGPETGGWTEEMLFDWCVQNGSDVVLELPATDEAVVLADTALSDLSVEQFSIVHIPQDDPLVA